ncbi:MAG: hypothetical protein JXA78_05700 [Anaerolineales bacterium]|nr:hypothetical protein [Anaerolineales bacterium]
MKRIHLFEFTDLPWYPQIFRRIQTDYLQIVVTRGAGHENLAPLLAKALQHAWEAGQASTGTPLFVFTYLLGYPYIRERQGLQVG